MFLDRSQPIRGGAAEIYVSSIPISRTVTKKIIYMKFFYSYRKIGPRKCFSLLWAYGRLVALS